MKVENVVERKNNETNSEVLGAVSVTGPLNQSIMKKNIYKSYWANRRKRYGRGGGGGGILVKIDNRIQKVM